MTDGVGMGLGGGMRGNIGSMTKEPRRDRISSRIVRVAWWAAAAALLATVFSAYLNPHLVVDLANRVWACF